MNSRNRKNKTSGGGKQAHEEDSDRLLNELKKKERQNLKLKKELAKKTEQIREEQDRFSDFYELAAVGFITLNNEGIIKEINLSAAELLETEKTSALDTYFIHYLQSDSISKFNKLLYDSRYSYDVVEGDFLTKTNHKEPKDIYLTAVPFIDYKTKNVSFRIFFYDITENKRIGRLLYESEKRFKLIAEASPVIIWMTDMNGRLEYINRTGYMFFGIKENISTELWLDTRHPEDKAKFLAELTAATQEQRSFTMELRVRNHKGLYRWVISTAVPRFLENGTFVGLIGSATDIDEEKNIRINLKKSLEEKEMLIREVHHRVKNNLQLILSLISLQSSILDDKKIVEVLKTTEDRVRSMALLHEKMYQTTNIKWVNSRDYLNDLVNGLFLSFNPSKNIELKVNFWEKRLGIGLSIAIGLIINELFTNSMKYAFPGNRKGEINIELKPSNDHELCLLFRDNGIGLPEESAKNNPKSFGLILVNSLVDQHGGTMKIIYEGCTEFHITLPYIDDFGV